MKKAKKDKKNSKRKARRKGVKKTTVKQRSVVSLSSMRDLMTSMARWTQSSLTALESVVRRDVSLLHVAAVDQSRMLTELKEEIQEMKKSLESRITKLERCA